MQGRTASLLVRIGLFLLLGGIIGLFQLDRASAERPALTAYVPMGLGGEADRERAQQFATSNPELADLATTSLLRHRPVPSSHLSLRAYYLVENDRPEEGGAALTLAAQRGWRDRYTQIMVLASAVANDNGAAAAQRLEALMRGRDEWEIQIAAARQVLEVESARQEFAARFADSPRLSFQMTQLVERDRTLAPDAARAIIHASELDYQVPCEEVSRIGRHLLIQGEADLALESWTAGCGTLAEINDYGFVYSDEEAGPFAWQFQRGRGVSTRPGRDDDAVTVVNRSPAARLVASRFALLEPGRHRFRLQSDDQRPSVSRETGETSLIMRCGNRDSGPFLPDQSDEAGVYEFIVPEGCPMQFIALNARRGRVADLKLTKL
ncbi:hypothetical protein K3163_07040 [Qipengyuania sp. 1NDW9]|uniref:hypothetical protein n=1 Tax=Qipengyuania xiapuensis TaxID=2867236 RepID=UPI001C8790EF|nr:hypothetical protein [Qipengyuania xiapuensis]MBX7492960.1 hypothetical protein [Qipengyuania xiapuensis]